VLVRGEHEYIEIIRQVRVYSQIGDLLRIHWAVPLPVKCREIRINKSSSYIMDVSIVGSRMKPIRKKYEFGECDNDSPYFKEL
jgi:hypothetical protein